MGVREDVPPETEAEQSGSQRVGEARVSRGSQLHGNQ